MGLRSREEIIKDIEKVEEDIDKMICKGLRGDDPYLLSLHEKLDSLYDELDRINEKEREV